MSPMSFNSGSQSRSRSDQQLEVPLAITKWLSAAGQVTNFVMAPRVHGVSRLDPR